MDTTVINTTLPAHLMLTYPARAAAALLAFAAVLAGCGGGGSGASGDAPLPVADAGVPSTATAQFNITQAGAEALVHDVEQRTRDLRLASGLTSGLKTGAAAPQGPLRALASLQMKQALRVIDYAGDLCSSGSASLDIEQTLTDRFDKDANATLLQGDRIGLLAVNCVVKAAIDLGTVALGDFGVGATINGRFDLTLALRSGNDIRFNLAYSQFSYQPYGGTAFAPLDATLVFGTVGGLSVYTLDIPQLRFLAAPQVSQVGNTVTVGSGQLRGQLPAATGAGYADYSFKSWVVDTTSLRASAGTVSASGAGGARVDITAGNTAYSVNYTVGGALSHFVVAH